MRYPIIRPLALTVLTVLTGCSTPNQHQVEEVETEIEAKESIGSSQIGLNDEGEVIIQRKTSAGYELESQQFINAALRDDLERFHGTLTQCRRELADPRLGGNGSQIKMPDAQGLKTDVDLREEFGITDAGDLRFVKREFYLERLKAERNYGEAIKRTLALLKQHNAECDIKLRHARVQSGLPAGRITAKGYFLHDGTWVQTQRGEKNLDDAFEIVSANQHHSKKP
jgi:hypothetical protein